MSSKRLFWCLGLVILFVLPGCSDSMSDEDYSHAWRDAVLQYRRINKNPNDPMADPSGTGDGSLESQARVASEIARQIADVGKSMKGLKAPDRFKNLQEETYTFYRGQADGFFGYSQALMTGDNDKIAVAADRLNNFAAEHQKIIGEIIRRLGTRASLFSESWRLVSTELPTKN